MKNNCLFKGILHELNSRTQVQFPIPRTSTKMSWGRMILKLNSMKSWHRHEKSLRRWNSWKMLKCGRGRGESRRRCRFREKQSLCKASTESDPFWNLARWLCRLSTLMSSHQLKCQESRNVAHQMCRRLRSPRSGSGLVFPVTQTASKRRAPVTVQRVARGVRQI